MSYCIGRAGIDFIYLSLFHKKTNRIISGKKFANLVAVCIFITQ